MTHSRVGCDATGGGRERQGVLGRVEIGVFRWWRVRGGPLPSEMSVGPLHNPPASDVIYEVLKKERHCLTVLATANFD